MSDRRFTKAEINKYSRALRETWSLKRSHGVHTSELTAADMLEYLQARVDELETAHRSILKEGDRLHTTNGTLIRNMCATARAALRSADDGDEG